MGITDDGAAVEAEAPASNLDSIFAEVEAELNSEATPDEVAEPSADPATEEPNTETEREQETEAPSEPASEDQPTYTVNIDGQNVEVTLDELTGGYLRQSDYTRKTQALARERERFAAFDALDRAFAENPQQTLQDLARSLGIDPAQLGAVQGTQQDPDIDPDDPVARKLAEIESWKRDVESQFAQREAAERQAAVDRELGALKTKFNAPDLDETALLRFAIDHGIGDLEMAYGAMQWQAQLNAPPAPTPAPETKLDSKRNAPKVEGGKNRNVGVRPGASDTPSWSEALAEAWQEIAR